MQGWLPWPDAEERGGEELAGRGAGRERVVHCSRAGRQKGERDHVHVKRGEARLQILIVGGPRACDETGEGKPC